MCMRVCVCVWISIWIGPFFSLYQCSFWCPRQKPVVSSFHCEHRPRVSVRDTVSVPLRFKVILRASLILLGIGRNSEINHSARSPFPR